MKSTGDGVLVESWRHDAVDWGSVTCNGRSSPRKPNTIMKAQRLAPRVAVHLGDVITTEFDVFGDGVNLAARLQQHSVPGGVILSKAVYDLVRGTVGPSVRDLGFLQLKNFEKPIRAYSLDPEASGPLDPEANERQGRDHRPSVAVLPFNNLSGDPQQEYFSDGMTEDLTTELSRFSELWSSREILPSSTRERRSIFGRSGGNWAHATYWRAASGGAAIVSASQRSSSTP